jgi:DNA recombination-mediator protein A
MRATTQRASRPPFPISLPNIAPDDLPVPSDDLSDPDLPYWLALNRVKGIGPARFRLLLDVFGSAAEVWRGSPSAWRAAGLDARTNDAFERQRPTIVPDAELERLIRLRVRAVRFIDPGYPKLLSEIPLPPAILYVRGAVTAEDEWALAVVGTRRASAYGRQMTERLVRELAAQRITIISGLAAALIRTRMWRRLTLAGAPSRCSAVAPIWSILRRTRGSPPGSSSRARW